MNTEINFLEQPKKQSSVPAFLLLLFIVLVIAVAGVLFMQHRGLSQSIEAEQSTLSTLKTQVAEQEEAYGRVSQLENTKRALIDIKQNMMPRVALYEDVLNMLNEPKQLKTVSYENKTNFNIKADFSNLKAVSDYIAALLEEAYVTDVETMDISEAGKRYDATLKLILDPDVVRKELGADAE